MKKVFLFLFLFTVIVCGAMMHGSGTRIYLYGMRVPDAIISLKNEDKNGIQMKFIGFLNFVKLDWDHPKVYCFIHNSDDQCILVDATHVRKKEKVDVDMHNSVITTDLKVFLQEIHTKPPAAK